MTDLDQWLAFAHVLGGVVWTGAWVAIYAFALDAVRHPELATVSRLYAVMRGLGPAVLGPSTLLVLGAGIALVARADWVAMGDLWIVLGLVLFVVVTLVGVLGLSRATRAAGVALDRGDLAEAVAATRTWSRLALVVTVLLVVATADMVLRP